MSLVLGRLKAVELVRDTEHSAQGRHRVGAGLSGGRVQFQGQVQILAEDAGQARGVALSGAGIARAQAARNPALLPAAEADQPRPLRSQRVPVQATRGQRLPLWAALDQRGQAAERAVASRISGEQHQLAGGGRGHRVGRRGHRDRHADDGLDGGCAAGAGKSHRAIQRVGIGQRQVRQAVGAGARHKLGHRGCSAKQREVRMDFEMGK